jgi:hypothetical protein
MRLLPLILFGLFVFVSSVVAEPSLAADKLARTRDLPPALRALGATQANVLTQQEACGERARGRVIFSQGIFVQYDAAMHINGVDVAFSGVAGGESVRLTFDSSGFQFSTRGSAVLVTIR